jgi:hypothetical protein
MGGLCKMKGKLPFMFVLGILVLSTFLDSAAVLADEMIPVSLVSVRLNGQDINPWETTQLDFERNQKAELRIVLDAYDVSQDIQVTAMITGYKHSNVNPILDSTTVFNVKGERRYVKNLDFNVPDDIKAGSYKLRLFISNKFGYTQTFEYNLDISLASELVTIRDVILSPSNNVNAGTYLIGTVRVKNSGDNIQDGVKIKLAIPELGVEGADYIEELESEESKTTEEIALRIPVCAKEGEYNVIVTVYYNDLYESTKETRTIRVIASDACEIDDGSKPVEKTIVSVSTMQNTAKIGEKAFFPITVVNTGRTTKTVSLQVSGADWATVEISPTNIMLVKGEDTGIATIYVAPKEGTQIGERMLSLDVMVDGVLSQQVPLRVIVEEAKNDDSQINLKGALEIAIVVLVIILVVIGLVLAFKKIRKDEDNDDESQTYY